MKVEIAERIVKREREADRRGGVKEITRSKRVM